MTSKHNNIAINIKDLTFKYSNGANSKVLNIPSWKVSQGESVLLIGSSGCGKSTLLNILSGILPVNNGQVSVVENDLDSMSDRQRDQFRASEIGYVAQSFNLIPYLSAIDNIKLTNYFAKTTNSNEKTQAIEKLLLELNIEKPQWNKPIKQLSIGQQQRIAIARAIVNKPKILLADEPTSALDENNRDQFMLILKKMAKMHNMTMIFVSHDLSLSQHFSRIDSMTDINVVEA